MRSIMLVVVSNTSYIVVCNAQHTARKSVVRGDSFSCHFLTFLDLLMKDSYPYVSCISDSILAIQFIVLFSRILVAASI